MLGCILACAICSTQNLVAAGPTLPGFDRVVPRGAVSAVLDGDTFDVDLDGDGGIQLPRERIRLLWVDTPELRESPKGQDRALGVPARDFLSEALRAHPLVLLVPKARPRGNHGRTLAVVHGGGSTGSSINLALIRAGHSYFDTRFSYPPGDERYTAYVEAEAEAFEDRLGIWSDPDSRERYLVRLAKEGKTPETRSNPRYAGVPLNGGLSGLEGRYIRIEGALASTKLIRSGEDGQPVGYRLVLQRSDRGGPVEIFASHRLSLRLGLDRWQPDVGIEARGFLKRYRDRLQLVLHYAARVP